MGLKLRKTPLSLNLALLALGLIWMSGCGGGSTKVPTGSVEGTVKLDGKPVTKGRVNFISSSTGAAAVANLDESGNYKLDSLEVGQYKVFITPPPQAPPKAGEPPPKMEQSNIPEKYQNEMLTDLSAEIKEGENKLKPFELKSSG